MGKTYSVNTTRKDKLNIKGKGVKINVCLKERCIVPGG